MSAAIKTLRHDLSGFRWMLEPASSLRLMLVIGAAWAAVQLVSPENNPITPFIFLSHPHTRLPKVDEVQKYGKGWKDVAFLSFYVIFFSFLRQSVVLYIVKPLAAMGGIKRGRKTERFTEQGYSLFYWGLASMAGLWVMSSQPTWWYKTEQFWLSYPQTRMRGDLKAYYLLQFSYWLQQLLVMVLGVEAPRSDYYELVAHHLVTLWLIGWSYLMEQTYIGTAVFFSMDIADVFLAASKLLNYLGLQRTSECTFAMLLVVWAYFRIWQNLRMLRSVWYDYGTLSPPAHRVFKLFSGPHGLAPWVRLCEFASIALLLVLNVFWYALMWKIVLRMLSGTNASDVREADDDAEEEVPAAVAATGLRTEDKKEK